MPQPSRLPERKVDQAEGRPSAEASDDARLVAELRAGDEAAFATLVERYHSGMIRVARVYLRDTSQAEEVAQEAWLSVLHGLGGFEGRSSLKTWIVSIVLNAARTRARQEQRSRSFAVTRVEVFEPAVEPERFRGPEDNYYGGWKAFPPSWGDQPEQRVLSVEVQRMIGLAIEQLPPAQREVVVLRDVQGLSSAEVCQVLQVSEVNQRVLLHRGRSKVRRGLAQYLAGE